MPMATPEEQREYQRQWVARRREKFFVDKTCVRCGSTDSLELDHIDRATKVTSHIWSWSKERRAEEIAKCQVLCANCHQDKTNAENKALFTYTDSCKKGHPLALVGTYQFNDGKTRCRYCRHIYDATRRGHKVKPLEEFIGVPIDNPAR